MFKKILLGLLSIIIILAAIILFNTFRYEKDVPLKTALPQPPLPDSAIAHLQKAITIKTISWAIDKPIDTAAFEAFDNFLKTAYPLVFQKMKLQTFSNFTMLLQWQGKNTALHPYVLMAHYDVVPVEDSAVSKWNADPFGGELKDDKIWGRGTIDDKGCVIAILEAAEKLIAENFQPEQTIYFSFGHNEEIGGNQGTSEVAAWFKNNKIQPEIVLDEGGMITKSFKTITRPVALISTAEKGFISFQLQAEIQGGHSSQPAKETAIDVLSKALVKLREEQMPPKFTAPVDEMFLRLGNQLPFVQRMALANRWLFQSTIISMAQADPRQNAMLHTTIVPTIFQSGIKDNVIPSVATATVNSRVLPGDDVDAVEAFMKTKINDDRIKITRLSEGFYTTPTITPVDSKAFTYTEKIVYETVKDALPSPLQLMGATDSRYFQGIATGIVKFTPFTDVSGYHGINEFLNVSDFRQMIFFYAQFIRESGE
ncbi:MAG TPA: M20/M25/M40 family metallo-hydrolase [Chitinophagaceae bacterium]|nr:M20/M25/M40 family metallo-hydrolase [Chitinophagaceae bacterium]